MVFLDRLKPYIRAMIGFLHFYLKPWLWYQRYPGKSKKYVRVLVDYLPAARTGIRKVWHTRRMERGAKREQC